MLFLYVVHSIISPKINNLETKVLLKNSTCLWQRLFDFFCRRGCNRYGKARCLDNVLTTSLNSFQSWQKNSRRHFALQNFHKGDFFRQSRFVLKWLRQSTNTPWKCCTRTETSNSYTVSCPQLEDASNLVILCLRITPLSLGDRWQFPFNMKQRELH